jgi:regulator of sigma E protease
MITILATIFVLGVIIFVHEFGHFLTAKAFGMQVFIFSFGFGKRLFGVKWGGTDLRVSLIPLGGYVKLEGEPDDFISEGQPEGEPVDVDSPRYFTNRPRWQRFLVYTAGPFMNAVLTVGVLTGLFMVGSQMDASRYDRPVVGSVEASSPAETAGIQPGDEILAIDGKPQKTWEDVQYNVLIRPETNITLRIQRGGEERDVVVRSGTDPSTRAGRIGVDPVVRVGGIVKGQPAEAAGLLKDDAILTIGDKPVASFDDIPRILSGVTGPLVFRVIRDGRVHEIPITPRDGKVGIERKTVTKKFGFRGSFREAVRATWSMTRQTFEVLGRLLTAKISPKTMMGPLQIAKASGEAASLGLLTLLNLVAMISLQVGLLNLFPLAPLDGGHMAILGLEGVARRDFSAPVKAWIMNAGAMVLFLLIGVVLYSDLSKISVLGRYLP